MVSYFCKREKERDLHKRVGYRHSCDNHDIHEKRDDHDSLIEGNKAVVLGKTVANQICSNGLEEVPVECGINKQVQELLDAIPVLVDDVICVIDLQTCRDPDIEDTDVDHRNKNGSGDHDMSRTFTVWDNDTDTVDNDLEQQLNLDTPPEKDSEVERKA